MCHNGGARYPTAFDSNTKWRVTSDTTFATNPNKPASGKNLYRFSSGHGGLYCSACHGSQHAEYPTLQANDKVYSVKSTGLRGKDRRMHRLPYHYPMHPEWRSARHARHWAELGHSAPSIC